MATNAGRGRCADCDRYASFELKEGGVQVALCEACLARRTSGLSLNRLTVSMRRKPREGTECPYCRTTLDELREHAMAGCPLCYEVFPAPVWQSFGLGNP